MDFIVWFSQPSFSLFWLQLEAQSGLFIKPQKLQKLPYLFTPERYGLLSTRAAKVTEEKWTNKDGSQSRGWLLRGSEGAPAVILLHKYGSDRSWVLNIGVKLNEATDFTVLMPDLRGHGEKPLVTASSFGGAEVDDLYSAMDYLKSLKSDSGNGLIKNEFGLYGVELGAITALTAAASSENVKAVVADSVPRDSNELLSSAVAKRYPFASFLTTPLAQAGSYLYFFSGGFNRAEMCDVAKKLSNRKVMMLASTETRELQASTSEISSCFPNQGAVEKKVDLMPSGFNIYSASNEQTGTYDLRVIDFFKKSLLTF